MKRIEFLKKIKDNITKHGYHITFVRDGQNPNFAYTIGLKEVFGFELVIAGGYVSIKLYEDLFDAIVFGLRSGLLPDNGEFKTVFEYWEKVGLRLIDKSWSSLIVLGVHDYYNDETVPAYQLFPIMHQFIDIPNMSKSWNKEDPIWCWLSTKWNKNIPISSYAVTSIDFLRGGTITEIMRWEEGYWEMFVGSGTNVLDKNVRILPISVLIGGDKTLQIALKLKEGEGVWRNDINSDWNLWQ